MKRRNSSRRPVLDLHPDESKQPRRNWHNKQKYSANDESSNKLSKASIRNIAEYNSDSDNENTVASVNLDAKLNDFLKEIGEFDSLSPESTSHVAKKPVIDCVWQECFDKSTGYAYYWNVETNAVTWEMPPEYKIALQAHTAPNNIVSAPSTEQCVKPVPHEKSKFVKLDSPQRIVYRVNSNNEKYKNDKPLKESKSRRRESDSEEEKIEMITSYGDDSGSEDEDNHKTEQSTLKKNTSTKQPSANFPTLPIGPTIIYRIQPEPQVIKPQQRQDAPKEILDYNLQAPSSFQKLNTVLTKFQNELKKESELSTVEDTSKKTPEISQQEIPIKDPNKTEPNNPLIALVAGYGDDSDPEEETHEIPETPKTLFPILDSQIDVKEPEIKLEAVVIDKPDVKIEPKLDIEAKPKPSYLDLQDNDEMIDTKAFKRKRRIAIDVFPRSAAQNTKYTGAYADPVPEERKGFGFSRNDESVKSDDLVTKDVKDKYKGMFIKAETINVSKEDERCENDEKDKDGTNKIDDMIELVNEKVIFLAEGKEPVSAVQAIAIQLQTLAAANKANALKSTYLHKWLEETSVELKKLEHEAAPTGWTCQWDRSNKRYFYRNQQTGEIQWQYPDTSTDIIGGGEAMDICTTPPPPDEDQEKRPPPAKPRTPPPPPIVKRPETPPPPIISDWSSQKKDQDESDEDDEKNTEQISETQTASEELDSIIPPLPPTEPVEVKPPLPTLPPLPAESVHSEPLPPGIDPPDLPYMIAKPKDSNPTVLPSVVDFTSKSDTVYDTQIINQQIPEDIVRNPTTNFPSCNVQSTQESKQAPNPDDTNLGSELESFYSDIASLESTNSQEKPPEVCDIPNLDSQSSVEAGHNAVTVEVKKRKKDKVKIASGLTLKKKKVSSLVEKWKRVQHDFKN